MKILAVRRGRAPNCSSAGMLVGAAIASAVVGAAVINAFADRFGGDSSDDDPPDGVRVRKEDFGGIIASEDPPALLFVDDLPTRGVTAVGGRTAPAGALSAPTEVHLAVTERCPASCTGCYLSAGPENESAEPSFEALRADLDQLAAMGVFEVAFGGGEAVLRDDIVELGRYARRLGIVPNLTTSGFGVTPKRARAMAEVFGQVNVSLDGLGAAYVSVRGWDGSELALRALADLSAAGVRVGVNTVLSRRNLDHLPELAAALSKLEIADWQWLRFKPTGRGATHYRDLALRPVQADGLFPLALSFEKELGLRIRFDCALAPFVAAHVDSPEHAGRLGAIGCVAGQSLLARGADGRWSGCSFAADSVEGGPDEAWDTGESLRAWRERAAAPPEPCGSCEWQSVCRGGCRVVAAHLTGDALAPDPECPKVRAS
ncbi:MAG: radical SAM protein [Proteobacteria bacterium]|nr:radical SAM protein [Pseudomonadota bacterium]